MGRKGKGGVARSIKKANGAVAAEAGATKTRQDETKAGASAGSPRGSPPETDERKPPSIQGLKAPRFNGRHAIFESESGGGGGGSGGTGSGSDSRFQLKLLVEAEDGSEQTLDGGEASISVKWANARVVCGHCFAPKPPNHCSRCKVSGLGCARTNRKGLVLTRMDSNNTTLLSLRSSFRDPPTAVENAVSMLSVY
jgi:hypothetical protein